MLVPLGGITACMTPLLKMFEEGLFHTPHLPTSALRLIFSNGPWKLKCHLMVDSCMVV